MKTIYTAILLVIVGYLLQPWKNAEAQNIKGQVYEKDDHGHKNPLPGVNVFWLKTTQGTTTNPNGEFTISAKNISDRQLVFSFLGYLQTQFLQVQNSWK